MGVVVRCIGAVGGVRAGGLLVVCAVPPVPLLSPINGHSFQDHVYQASPLLLPIITHYYYLLGLLVVRQLVGGLLSELVSPVHLHTQV